MGKETGNGLLIFHAALRSRNRKDTIYTMKTSLLSLCLAIGICAAMPAALAQDATDSAASPAAGQKVSKKAKKKAVTIKPGKANKAIGKLRTVNGVKPNRKALYYIVFQSASWCGACNAEMPNIAKAYEEMKAAGGLVEVVLASSDHDAPPPTDSSTSTTPSSPPSSRRMPPRFPASRWPAASPGPRSLMPTATWWKTATPARLSASGTSTRTWPSRNRQRPSKNPWPRHNAPCRPYTLTGALGGCSKCAFKVPRRGAAPCLTGRPPGRCSWRRRWSGPQRNPS